MKQYYTQDNIGSAKYTISYHDGVSMNKDGSPFFGIHLFNNKVKFNKKTKALEKEGYKQI
jgi:hypothetical protein